MGTSKRIFSYQMFSCISNCVLWIPNSFIISIGFESSKVNFKILFKNMYVSFCQSRSANNNALFDRFKKTYQLWTINSTRYLDLYKNREILSQVQDVSPLLTVIIDLPLMCDLSLLDVRFLYIRILFVFLYNCGVCIFTYIKNHNRKQN